MAKDENTMVNNGSGYKTGTYNPNSFNVFDSGLCFLIYMLASLVANIVMNLVSRGVKSSGTQLDPNVSMLIGILLAQGSMLIVTLIFCKVRKVSYLSGGGFECRLDWKNILYGCMLVLGIMFICSSVHEQFAEDVQSFLLAGGAAAEGAETEQQGNIFVGLLLNFIIIPIVPAIVEEGMFRGVVLRGANQAGAVFAIAISSVCFTFMHGNVYQIVIQFILGLAIACVVLLTRNFLIGCIMHLANNFFSSIIAAILAGAKIASPVADKVVDAIFILIGLALFTIAVIYFVRMLLEKQKNKLLEVPEQITAEDEKKFALIKTNNAEDEYEQVNWKNVQPAKFDYAGMSYSYKGKTGIVNGKGREKPAKLIYAIGIVFAIAMIIVGMILK